MDSLDDIWKSIIDKLSEELTATSINAWFSDCRPVDLTESRLVLQTTNNFKRDQIRNRFGPILKKQLDDLFSCDMEILVLVGDEVEEYESENTVDDVLPEALDYTFDRFIVGKSNEFAHAAAIAVAENPGKVHNPLFIYGNSGLGKTHLLLAIGQSIRERDPGVNIGYIKGDDFTNQMVRSIREGTAEEFRMRYRNVELFLVDDIQFISGKQGTQEEFFHTFNNIYEAGHQIVITSDRPPRDMAALEDRLRSRFEGGLMVDIQPPDIETRMAITRNKAQGLGLLLSDEVVSYIAENITANVRQIEGVIHKLTAYRSLMGDKITVDSVKRAIEDVIKTGIYIPTPDVIIHETARYFDVDPADIRGQRRSKDISLARQVSIYLMRTLINFSLKDIGTEIGGRNHSTILSSIRKIEDLMVTDPSMAATIRDITSNINSLHER